ncbi:MAG: hypothetical protein QF921_08465 [Pseudomonadales bacterium]|jgi:hypothetical protein|nr:hypothetical protein [Pseudomonadales bacterium]
MANKLYPEGAEFIMNGAINLSTADLRIALLTSGYTYSAAHNFMDDCSGGFIGAYNATPGATTGFSPQLASVVSANGNLNAEDATIAGVAAGSTITQWVLYENNASSSAAKLIMHQHLDGSANPISIATNGGDISIAFNASGLFTI